MCWKYSFWGICYFYRKQYINDFFYFWKYHSY